MPYPGTKGFYRFLTAYVLPGKNIIYHLVELFPVFVKDVIILQKTRPLFRKKSQAAPEIPMPPGCCHFEQCEESVLLGEHIRTHDGSHSFIALLVLRKESLLLIGEVDVVKSQLLNRRRSHSLRIET